MAKEIATAGSSSAVIVASIGSVKQGTVAVAGTTPRVWYYMLRAVDPAPGKLPAIPFSRAVQFTSLDRQSGLRVPSRRS